MKLIIALIMIFINIYAYSQKIPPFFVELKSVIPDVVYDIRYNSIHNFVGDRINGYRADKCYVTIRTARALAKVQSELKKKGYSLKMYDCYRPKRAVAHFVRWAKEIDNTKTKMEFYPYIDKRLLFKKGFISSKSTHSKGGTVDLTIVKLPVKPQPIYIDHSNPIPCYSPGRYKDNSINMGTGFDCFSPLSATKNKSIPFVAQNNRKMLKNMMEKYGFKNYSKEWWHYEYKNNVYKRTRFDFIVK